MVPLRQVGEILIAGHNLRLLAIVEHHILHAVEAQAQFRLLVQEVAGNGGNGRLENHLVLVAIIVVPHLDGIAVAPCGGDGADVGLRTVFVVNAQTVVLVLQYPGVLHGEVVGMARVGGHGAVTLVHGPVVGQSIDVVVLGLILLGSGYAHVAINIV